MGKELEPIIELMNSGDYEGAEHALVTLVSVESQNPDAWMLLGHLREEPSQKADCYRRVLRIDPGNERARDRLQKLMKETGKSLHRWDFPKEEKLLRCPKCSAAMNVGYIGDMKDKRVICTFCGTEIDLPDSFKRETHKPTGEQGVISSRIVDETTIETRDDGRSEVEEETSGAAEVQEMIELLEQQGITELDIDFLKKLQSHGISLSVNPDAEDLAPAQTPEEGEEFEDAFTDETSPPQKEPPDIGLLEEFLEKMGFVKQESDEPTAEELTAMIEETPPASQRRTCPNPRCGASIPKNAKWCPWCSTEL
jgi:hypothetical protein